MLALLETTGDPPYLSAAVALVLCTVAVISLINYREAGLLGYLPRNIADGLRREIGQELRRAQRPGAGRSVENHSRRVVAADLQIFQDLLSRLMDSEDVDDVVACVEQLGNTLDSFVRVKHRLHPDSLFFERRQERLHYGDIEDSIVDQGLMNPTTDVPDHLWLERRVLAIVRPIASSELMRTPAVSASVIGMWSSALQYAWIVEDPDVVDLMLTEVELVAADPALLGTPDVADRLTTVPWLIVEAVGRGWHTSAEQIVDEKPWEDVSRSRALPWAASEDARELGRHVMREIAIAGRIVTPRWAMVAEIESRRAPRLDDLRARMIDRALDQCRTELRVAVDNGLAGAPAVARMTLLTLLRVSHHAIALPKLDELAGLILRAFDTSLPDDAEDLRQDASRAARVFAAREQWDASFVFLHVAATAGAISRSRQSDPHRSLILLFDAVFTAAAVHTWAEYHRRMDHLTVLGRYIQAPYVDLDRLVATIGDHGLVNLMLPSIDYTRWFQPLMQAVRELPERPVLGRGLLSYRTEKDHPSPLISRSELLFGPEDCLRHLVTSVVRQRDDARTRLLAALRAVQRRRRSSG